MWLVMTDETFGATAQDEAYSLQEAVDGSYEAPP
jgi:hypothetical protein